MKIDITVPTSMSEIPLTRYQKFIEMRDKSNDEEFIAQKTIQIFCGIELKEVMQIRLKDLNDLVKHFTNIFQHKPKLIRQFKIQNYTFGFISNLDNISFGEYVDIEHNLQNWNTYHKAMAVMYRPIKEEYKDKYSIIDYEPNPDMQELMKFAPLDVALGASVFFYDIGTELLNVLKDSFHRELMKMKDSANTPKELSFPDDGHGIQASIDVLTETLQNSILSPNYPLFNVLPISRSKKKKQKSKTEKLNAN